MQIYILKGNKPKQQGKKNPETVSSIGKEIMIYPFNII